MSKVFECFDWSYEELTKKPYNRLVSNARLVTKTGIIVSHQFVLDTGAIISVLSRRVAELNDLYDYNVQNRNAFIGGFDATGNGVKGRVVIIDRFVIGKNTVMDTQIFIPDEYKITSEVIGANVLNALVPIPDFEERRIWFFKNKSELPVYESPSLGVTLETIILAQEDSSFIK